VGIGDWALTSPASHAAEVLDTLHIFGQIQAGSVTGASAITGALKLAHASSSNLTTIQPGNASAAVVYTLPTAAPAGNGYALVSTTGGVMSWAVNGAGETLAQTY